VSLSSLNGFEAQGQSHFFNADLPSGPSRFEEVGSMASLKPFREVDSFKQKLLVPSEYDSIQDAVDAARDGDTILVDQSHALESFMVHNKDLIIRGVPQEGGELPLIGQYVDTDLSQGVSVYRSTLVIEGFRFANIRSSQGALDVDHSEVHVRNCEFIGNAAVSGGSRAAQGGAISFNSPAKRNKSTVTGCRFESNSAKWGGKGGAIYVQSGWLDIEECEFALNEADEGGAVCYAGGQGTLADCYFNGNGAWKGGGLRMLGATSLQLVSCEFIGNRADFGGGLHAGNVVRRITGSRYTISPPATQSCTLRSCTFRFNTAWGEGGGAYLVQGGHYMFQCEFESNEASWSGPALFIEDAYVRSTTRLHATTMCQNFATYSTSQIMGDYVDEGANCISQLCGEMCENRLDLNGDGYIDWTDWSICYNAMITLLHTTGSNECLWGDACEGDVNDDGVIDRLDWTLIQGHIYGH
tara:strand:+ start:3943 stop:5349 length:1407 start_codon:yes stop_codon:yes gene_type:complete